MGSQKRIEIPEEIRRRVQIKNVKDGFGHDLAGMFCDIWIDKKNVGHFNDDGWGGEPEIALLPKDQETILSLLEKYQWRHKMFTELGWNFYGNEEKITDDSVIVSLIEHLYDEKQKEKSMKKIAKQSEREILVGNWYAYTRFSLKGNLPLAQLVKIYGVEKLQQYVDSKIKPKIKEGEGILNTNFEELGLTK